MKSLYFWKMLGVLTLFMVWNCDHLVHASQTKQGMVNCFLSSQGFNFGAIDVLSSNTSAKVLASLEVTCSGGAEGEGLHICMNNSPVVHPEKLPFALQVGIPESYRSRAMRFDRNGRVTYHFDIEGTLFFNTPSKEKVIPRSYNTNIGLHFVAFKGDNQFCGPVRTAYAHKDEIYSSLIPVVVSVIPQCLVEASDVHFGAHVDFIEPRYAQAKISAKCTRTTHYSITLDKGSNGGISVTEMKMSMPGSSHKIIYGLYSDPSHITPWKVEKEKGLGASRDFSVYGKIYSQPTPPAGIYRDRVTVTVNF